VRRAAKQLLITDAPPRSDKNHYEYLASEDAILSSAFTTVARCSITASNPSKVRYLQYHSFHQGPSFHRSEISTPL
jgi:hypothetical protein